MAFSLLFFDPMAPEDEKWNFVIEIAFDPHNPLPEEEKRVVEDALNHIMEGVGQILNPDEDPMKEFTIRGDLN